MFNLEKTERHVIAILLFTLLIGSCLLLYKRWHSPDNFRMGRFSVEGRGAVAARDGSHMKRKVNINEAGTEELSALDGIGATLAGRIINYRGQNGPFGSVEGIKKVKGIGAAVFEKIKDEISVE